MREAATLIRTARDDPIADSYQMLVNRMATKQAKSEKKARKKDLILLIWRVEFGISRFSQMISSGSGAFSHLISLPWNLSDLFPLVRQ